MTPAQALIEWLTSSGVRLSLEGDAIVHRGPRRVLTPNVLAKLSQHKAEAIAELKRLRTSFTDHADSTSSMDADDNCDHVPAENKAIAKFGSGSKSELADVLSNQILGRLCALGPPTDVNGRRLLDETRAFVTSPCFARAVALDWPLVELFGICPVTPAACPDRRGLVTGLALSVHSGAVITEIQPGLARVRYRSGKVFTYCKGKPAMIDAVLWWECAALIGGD